MRLTGEVTSLSIEEKQRRAEDAFVAGHYSLPFDESALSYAYSISVEDPSNPFAVDMLERIRKAMHETADAAVKRGDFLLAKDTYNQLIAYYSDDKDAPLALARLENQLSARKGEVAGLIRKAEEALQQDRLIEPASISAYNYVMEALLIDSRNELALALKTRIRDRVLKQSEQTYANGDEDAAIRQLRNARKYFSGDSIILARLNEWTQGGTREAPQPVDASARRIDGLKKYRHGNYAEAITDLETAATNNQGTPEVIFALADSYWKVGQHNKAAHYFREVPPYADDQYKSSIGALGDIALERGDKTRALDYFKRAREMGGSILYTVAKLDDKIERIENQQREKAEKPENTLVSVRHVHGGLFGDRSCQGTLTVSGAGVTYKSNEHNYSANLVAVGVSVEKDEMTVTGLQSKPVKFKISFSEAERFRQALSKFQIAARN